MPKTIHLENIPDKIIDALADKCPGGTSVHRYVRVLVYEHVGATCPPLKKRGGKRRGAGRKPVTKSSSDL